MREFTELPRLPEAVQRAIEGKQLGLGQTHTLSRLHARSLTLQLAAAETLAAVASERARLFVAELIANPALPVREAMERAAAEEAEQARRVRLAVLVPKERSYQLSRQARQREGQPAVLAPPYS